ncbi:MAG: hypothetical protein M8357_15980 [Desulfobulbaceae bacterium]|nr:hypothetical protein [Desulfobulbaceae bacterium]
MNKQVLTGLLLIFIAFPAFASIPAFAEIDEDQDGAISMSEAVAAGISQRLFAELDLDKDEKLSPEEYSILPQRES